MSCILIFNDILTSSNNGILQEISRNLVDEVPSTWSPIVSCILHGTSITRVCYIIHGCQKCHTRDSDYLKQGEVDGLVAIIFRHVTNWCIHHIIPFHIIYYHIYIYIYYTNHMHLQALKIYRKLDEPITNPQQPPRLHPRFQLHLVSFNHITSLPAIRIDPDLKETPWRTRNWYTLR